MKSVNRFITLLYTELKQKKRVAALFLSLFAVVLYTRFAYFEDYVMFLGDQGRDASILLKLITFENLPFIGAPSSIGQVYLGPFYYYLVAPFLPLFNWSPVGPAFGVALISIIASIIATVLIIRRFGYAVGFVFLALLTFSMTLIELARFSWNPNLLPYFSFATLSLFVIWQRKKTILTAVLFGILMGLSFQLHYLMVFMGLPILIVYAQNLRLLSSGKERISSVIQLITSFGAFLLTLSPLILFDIKHKFVNFTQLLALVRGGGLSESDFSYPEKVGQTITGLLNHSLGFSVDPIIGVVIFSFVVVGGFFLGKKKGSPMLTAHTLAALTYVLGFAYISSPRLAHYYVPIYLSFYLVVSALILALPNKKRVIAAAILVGVFATIQIPRYYFLKPQERSQIEIAQERAESFFPHIAAEPIQIVTIPYTESHGHYRYFIELEGYDLLDETSPDQPQELFVMCFQECKPQDDPQWQIAAFENKQLAEQWVVDGVTIYKIVHGLP